MLSVLLEADEIATRTHAGDAGRAAAHERVQHGMPLDAEDPEQPFHERDRLDGQVVNRLPGPGLGALKDGRLLPPGKVRPYQTRAPLLPILHEGSLFRLLDHRD